jgi:hypothetical protein
VIILTSLRILEVKPAVAGVRSGVRSVSYGMILSYFSRQHAFLSLLEKLIGKSGWLMVQRRKWGGKLRRVDVKVEVILDELVLI